VLAANEVLEKGLALVGFDEDDCHRGSEKEEHTLPRAIWLQTFNVRLALIRPSEPILLRFEKLF
jgi:hypothetical protein